MYVCLCVCVCVCVCVSVCLCLARLPLQSRDPPGSCRCRGRCRGSRNRSWRSQTGRAVLYLWVQTSGENLIPSFYSDQCYFTLLIKLKPLEMFHNKCPPGRTLCVVNYWKAFNLKCTEEALTAISNSSNKREQKERLSH